MSNHRIDKDVILANIKDPEFWNNLWQQQLLHGNRKKATEPETIKANIERWEKRAQPFAKNVLGKKGNSRVEKIINWMKGQGVSLEDIRILDIGSGLGSFTIPFATYAKEVVALEPVTAMTDFLRQEIKNRNITNITIVEEPWETVSIEDNDWIGSFDLVFASMVPGVNDIRTIEKAINCSRAYCYISSFAGKREYIGLRDLWPILFEQEHPPFHIDIQHQLNLIYTMGYNFSFRVWEERRDNEFPAEEAAQELLHQLQLMVDDYLYNYVDENKQVIMKKIADYVDKKTVAGVYKHESVTRLGAILINV
ncbi:class I SAM-dependent methyltransferase [Desulfuribacillus alkaliarsenatis]|uniref:Methyltransferase domain-containing protein n=1 Tax=Desulfuribacillus alkaliarsenatis TaxID=766136 RepID=A0A1E5G0T4_9FIRM|nr:methyltransferase domain-containing protein [Desulfuribacillus alkaliarsenatis]OEF96515.1 hypothetical protein BHF68_07635 [Desulfuribacillus alkaliarsenatis]